MAAILQDVHQPPYIQYHYANFQSNLSSRDTAVDMQMDGWTDALPDSDHFKIPTWRPVGNNYTTSTNQLPYRIKDLMMTHKLLMSPGYKLSPHVERTEARLQSNENSGLLTSVWRWGGCSYKLSYALSSA